MELSKILEVIIPYLEKSGMGGLVTICLNILLIATTVWVVAWVIDRKSIKNLFNGLYDLFDFSKNRFSSANKSPYDDVVENSKAFQIIYFSYCYLITLLLLIFSSVTLYMGFFVKAESIVGNILVVFFGFVIIVLARFVKVAGDKAYYKFENSKEWEDETQ